MINAIGDSCGCVCKRGWSGKYCKVKRAMDLKDMFSKKDFNTLMRDSPYYGKYDLPIAKLRAKTWDGEPNELYDKTYDEAVTACEKHHNIDHYPWWVAGCTARQWPELPWIVWARANLDRLGSAEAQREGGLRIAAVYGPGVK